MKGHFVYGRLRSDRNHFRGSRIPYIIYRNPTCKELSNNNIKYKGSERGGLSTPPSSVVRNALVVIDDGIESVNVKNRYQGARVSARRANHKPEDGIRWKFVHGRVVVVR